MGEALSKSKVLLGVTGSIAAYKSAEIARLLVSRGYTVRVVMTEAAARFISPLTMQSVTGEQVVTEFWEEENTEISHIELADWADVVLVAPATADFLARIRQGMAGDPLSAILLATKAPILIAPAMNVNMWENPRTQENVAVLKEQGIGFVEPGVGALACGWQGSGRLAEPWDIFHYTLRHLSPGDYKGMSVLISTGPTREPIDPVRYISNRSSGKMGVALAREAFRRGADVTVVHGPVNVKVPSGIECVPVMSALDMQDEMVSRAFHADNPPDVIIMAAAVADFRPKEAGVSKIKKAQGFDSIPLVENPDILSELGKKRGEGARPLLIGFAVETGEIEELLGQLEEKIVRKKVDLIIGNLAEDAFDLDTNRVWMVDKYGKQEEVATTFKSRVAKKNLESSIEALNADESMTKDNNVLSDCVSYLESVRSLYPGGIPERFLHDRPERVQGEMQETPASHPGVEKRSFKAIFLCIVEDLSKESSALLSAAVTKGLKWKMSDIDQVVFDRSSDLEKIRAAVSLFKGAPFLVLGSEVFDLICQAFPEAGGFEQGRKVSLNGETFFLTHDLQTICRDACEGKSARKKEFWHDLLRLKQKAELSGSN